MCICIYMYIHICMDIYIVKSPPREVKFSIEEQLLRSDEKRFRGGLVFKARRLWYHSTLG